MKPRSLIIASVLTALALLIWRPWRASFNYHFNFPLPQTAKLINYHHSWGRDSSDEFEFAVTDNALRDAIIKQWNLKPAIRDEDAISFTQSTATPSSRLKTLPERYGRVEQETTRYWSLWIDRPNGKVYAEYGDW